MIINGKEVSVIQIDIDAAIVEMINVGDRLINNEYNSHLDINSVSVTTEFVKVLLKVKKRRQEC